jgi:hypothetical protein
LYGRFAQEVHKSGKVESSSARKNGSVRKLLYEDTFVDCRTGKGKNPFLFKIKFSGCFVKKINDSIQISFV